MAPRIKKNHGLVEAVNGEKPVVIISTKYFWNTKFEQKHEHKGKKISHLTVFK